MNLISQKEKIFVAGHNGMVGKSICKSLKESGYDNLLTISRKKLDLVEKLPKIIAVQPEGCNVIIESFKAKKKDFIVQMVKKYK